MSEITLSEIRKSSKDKLVIGNLNINSLSNKFDQLKFLIQHKLDILVITETKLDNTFPLSQFQIEGFSQPYRYDRNRNGGGVLIYIREDIPSKILPRVVQTDIEAIFIEINLRKSKWLLCGCYHPPSQSDEYFFYNLGNSLDKYNNYDKFLLVGDFNAEVSEPILSQFLSTYNAKSIVKDKTCFKSVENPSCIDLFITNQPMSFQIQVRYLLDCLITIKWLSLF